MAALPSSLRVHHHKEKLAVVCEDCGVVIYIEPRDYKKQRVEQLLKEGCL